MKNITTSFLLTLKRFNYLLYSMLVTLQLSKGILVAVISIVMVFKGFSVDLQSENLQH